MSDEEIESTTHDVGDQWAEKARSGWSRCPDCGEEWAVEDDSGCLCEDEEEEG